MKRIVILAAMCLLLISCSLPFTINWNTPTPEPQVTVETQLPTEAPVATTEVPITPLPFEGTEYNLGGVYMVVPECLAVIPSGVIVPAVPYDAMGGPMEFYPQHRMITFEDYVLSGKFFDPVIRVYSAAEFAAMNTSIADRITDMNSLLASQVADPAETIPFLPIFNAAQIFRARVGFVPFQNGSGVRFLTEYGQYSAPVNNNDLFYTYQGLTADGKYWVSAIFPINAPWLQETWNSTTVPVDGVPFPSLENQDAVQAYYVTMTDRLNAAEAEGFTPSALCLDQFMQSLNIGD